MPAHVHRLQRAPARLAALPLAVLLAVACAAHAAAPAPSPAAPRSPAGQLDYQDPIERAQERVREAVERSQERAREAVERGQERAREAIERAQEQMRDAQADVLLADVDFDIEWPTLAFIGSEFGATREIVKNAPYTADAVSESIQLLQDGNRIVKRTTTRLARDTYGRTRQEKETPRGSIVYIFDPIDDRNYALNPQKRLAVRIPRVPALPAPPVPSMDFTPPVPGAPLAPAVTSGTPLAPRSAVTPPTPVTPGSVVTPVPPVPPVPPGVEGTETQRVVVRRGDGAGHADDVRVEVIRIGGRDAPGAGAGMPTPAIALPLLPQGKGERKSLGTRDFDGVKADGTQTTHTIPAGQIGNERPIVVTSERWFSPELQLVVFARTSDPRAGETIYRLANLRRGEPPADLFRVPSDYRKRDSRG